MINHTGSLSEWWSAVSRAALFGTARRDPPEPPEGLPHRPEGSPETAILDAAALGGALVRAGSWPKLNDAHDHEPAGPDLLREPPARARQLLELIITQSPAGRQLQKPLLVRWLQAAAAAGCRAPRSRLPMLIELATVDDQLRPALARIADTRGRWLAGLRSDWDWLLGAADDHFEAGAWARRPTAERAAIVCRLRPTDPTAARELVASAMRTDGAADRATLIECLRIGIGPADEPLLESALDDRSAQVRQAAAGLLDSLPGSARADRMAARLRPLITVRGVITKVVNVRLPEPPDDAAVRDGLGNPPARRSERGYWLEQLAAGAPLAVWTDATGRDPARTLSMISDEDALAGIRRAVLGRRAVVWARALARRLDSPELLALLPEDERDQEAAQRVRRRTDFATALALINVLPPPWGPEFSRAVVDAAERSERTALAPVITRLAYGLDRTVLPRLREFADARRGYGEAEAARNLVQYLTLSYEIPEAFL